MVSSRTYKIPKEQIRHLDISDVERVERYKRAGYGGSVSDALWALGVVDTVFSQRFKALRQGMQLVGRALPVKLHTFPIDTNLGPGEDAEYIAEYFKDQGGHPQQKMMRALCDQPDGSVLVFDCGGDMQPAHFGEMSCQLAKSHGCKGILIAGNCRDTQYVLKIEGFPVFSFGTAPNAFGGWVVNDVNIPIMIPGHLTHYVTVCPGDFIFGDNDGVQLIPEEVVDEVLLRVEEIFERENQQRELLAAGMTIEEVYERYGVL